MKFRAGVVVGLFFFFFFRAGVVVGLFFLCARKSICRYHRWGEGEGARVAERGGTWPMDWLMDSVHAFRAWCAPLLPCAAARCLPRVFLISRYALLHGVLFAGFFYVFACVLTYLTIEGGGGLDTFLRRHRPRALV